MTQDMIDELALAKKVNLQAVYTRDDFIYQVDSHGDPVPFHGVNGDLSEDGTDPCLMCTEHTKEKWEKYKEENPWIDNPNINKPDDNTSDTEDPGTEEKDNNGENENWWDNIWPFSGEGEEE